MKRVLVAGSTGFIGSQLTAKMAALHSTNFQVLAMSRKDGYSSKRAHPEIGKFRNVEFVQADLLKTESYP